ncbi:uncharacterized protein LOC128239883 isoform X1 [Mya arenaria]|uniref:uncharacterized protein LOC128239883 isoform X1 n=1 Tax=Mya arenaria TaxID=6604 RepID=UPI0022E79A59|nr:uncharacterized protein LOC128239883 isoform X1 [Mya arenaria]
MLSFKYLLLVTGVVGCIVLSSLGVAANDVMQCYRSCANSGTISDIYSCTQRCMTGSAVDKTDGQSGTNKNTDGGRNENRRTDSAQIDRRCYMCTDCNETTQENIYTAPCPGSCYKFSGENENRHKIIHRGCLSLGAESARFHKNTEVTVKIEKYKGDFIICNGHKCNAATSMFATVWITAIVFACLACLDVLFG